MERFWLSRLRVSGVLVSGLASVSDGFGAGGMGVGFAGLVIRSQRCLTISSEGRETWAAQVLASGALRFVGSAFGQARRDGGLSGEDLTTVTFLHTIALSCR